MNMITFEIARQLVYGMSGGSLPADVEPSTDPMGDLNKGFNTASADLLNRLNLPGIPEFHFD